MLLALVAVSIESYSIPDHLLWDPLHDPEEILLNCGECECEANIFIKCEAKDTLEKVPHVTSIGSHRKNNFKAM